MHNINRILLAALLAAPLLLGCGQRRDQGDSLKSTYWEKGAAGGSLTVAAGEEITGFNPFYGYETMTELLVHNLVFAAPLRQHPISGDWVGQLAENWEYIEDRRGVRITLRTGLEWSDGSVIDAEDVVESLNKVYLHPESDSYPRTTVTDNDLVVEVTKENDLTFTIVLDRPHFRLMTFASLFPFPNELIESKSTEEISMLWMGEDDLDTLVTSGPYKLARYVVGESVELTANRDYCLKDEWGQQLPYIRNLKIAMGDMAEHVADFDSRKPSLIGSKLSDLEPLLPPTAKGIHTYDFDLRDTGNYVLFNLNPKDSEEDTGIAPPHLSWLQERKFRQAMAHLLDRERLNRQYYAGNGVLNYTFLIPGSQHLPRSIEDDYLRFDPVRAARLLDELAYIDRNGDGFREDPEGNVIELEILTNHGNEGRIGTAEVLADEAAKIGVRLIPSPDDFGRMLQALTKAHDFDMVIVGVMNSLFDLRAYRNLIPSWGGLHATYPNQDAPHYDWEKEIDRLWNAAANTPDEAASRRSFEEIQRIWLRECPWFYTVDERVLYVSSVDLGNMRIDAGTTEAPFFERIFLR